MTFVTGLAKPSWQGRLSFRTFPNGKKALVDGAHLRVPPRRPQILLLPFRRVCPPQTIRSI